MISDALKEAKIIVVDDEWANIELLKMLLKRWGFMNIVATSDSTEVVGLVRAVRPDLILLDLHMPNMDGFDVLKGLREVTAPDDYVPVLVLTADITNTTKQRALSGGARDFLVKPFDATEVLLRVTNLLETRRLHTRLENYSTDLAREVETRTQQITQKSHELDATRLEVLKRLARAAEFRDDDTGQHTIRVGVLSAEIARVLGKKIDYVTDMREAAPLHDLGKIGIPDAILLKPGKLTPEEWDIMKTHTTIGANILSGSKDPLLRLSEEIALTHHEKWNGTGYMRMKGTEIPLSGRIVAIADVFDALSNDRPYKKAWTQQDAVAEILRQRGEHFDPDVVDAFKVVLERMITESGELHPGDAARVNPALRPSATG